MVIALSGATGFLGRRVAQLADVKTRLHRGDPRWEDPAALARDLAGVDAVVHLAGHYVNRHGPADVLPLVDANIRLGAVLLEAAALAGVRVVLADTPMAWTDAGAANLYGATRRALAALAAAYTDLPVVRVLIHDTYGPDDPRPKLVPALLRARATGAPLPISAAGAVDLIHVDDAARGVLLAVEPATLPGAFAIRSGVVHTPLQVLRLLEEVDGKPIPHQVTPGAPSTVLPWAGPDLPGFAPEIPLPRGLRALCESSP